MIGHSTKTTLLICATLILFLPNAIFPQEPEPKNKDKKENKESKENKENKEKKVSVTSLRIEVTALDLGDPVNSADVFVKSEAADTRFDRAVKTNDRGVANLPGVPRGPVLVQVTARGFKPCGSRYELTQEKEIKQVRLERSAN
jgi:hypothetical protein